MRKRLDDTSAVIITARWAALRPRTIRPRPTSSKTALVPFSVALMAGNTAYCSGTICITSGCRLGRTAVHHQECQPKHEEREQYQGRQRLRQRENLRAV